MIRIDVETKPRGSGRNWLEVGTMAEPDDFGDRKWVPSANRYPHNDTRLKVQRKYDGRGNSQRIRWIIDVPEDFPLAIVRTGGKIEFLFTPVGEGSK